MIKIAPKQPLSKNLEKKFILLKEQNNLNEKEYVSQELSQKLVKLFDGIKKKSDWEIIILALIRNEFVRKDRFSEVQKSDECFDDSINYLGPLLPPESLNPVDRNDISIGGIFADIFVKTSFKTKCIVQEVVNSVFVDYQWPNELVRTVLELSDNHVGFMNLITSNSLRIFLENKNYSKEDRLSALFSLVLITDFAGDLYPSNLKRIGRSIKLPKEDYLFLMTLQNDFRWADDVFLILQRFKNKDIDVKRLHLEDRDFDRYLCNFIAAYSGIQSRSGVEVLYLAYPTFCRNLKLAIVKTIELLEKQYIIEKNENLYISRDHPFEGFREMFPDEVDILKKLKNEFAKL